MKPSVVLSVLGALEALKGVARELDDCAFPLLDDIIVTSNPEDAFKDANLSWDSETKTFSGASNERRGYGGSPTPKGDETNTCPWMNENFKFQVSF